MPKKLPFGTIVVGGLILLSATAYVVLDVLFHGPQVVWYNERCERIVRDKGLIGATPAAVEAALGRPSSVRTYAQGTFTYNYAPHPWFPFAQFQAHFKYGRLSGIELFDD